MWRGRAEVVTVLILKKRGGFDEGERDNLVVVRELLFGFVRCVWLGRRAGERGRREGGRDGGEGFAAEVEAAGCVSEDQRGFLQPDAVWRDHHHHLRQYYGAAFLLGIP
jgi:hypothetical protein